MMKKSFPRRFKNLEESPLGTLKWRDMARFLLGRFFDARKVIIPEGHVLPENEAISAFEAISQDSITWLGHSCFLIRLQGKTLLTDPFLTEVAGIWKLGPKRFVPPGISIEQLPPIDIILVSHNHYDHLDIKTIRQLKDRDKAQVVIPLNLSTYFKRYGYQNIYELDWHESIRLNDICMTALPAIHYSRRGLFDKNKSLWASFAIDNGKHRLYFSGDTAYGKMFKAIGAEFGPFDAAMMSIGACEPRCVMGFFHLSPEEAVQAGLDMNAKNLIGMHWGTILLSEEGPFEPAERFQKAASQLGVPEEFVWVMRIGETRILK